MAVLKTCLTVDGFPSFPCLGMAIRPLDPSQDRSHVHRLVVSLGQEHPQNPAETTRIPSPAGLLAEVQSRPGRQVWAWLARAEIAGGPPAGLVVLVQAGAAAPFRWSIAWLLVDPAHRRRGIGLFLVATAVQFAGDRGATHVHAETLDRWPGAAAFWQAARLAAERRLTRLPTSGESRKTAEG